jgi:hypothetical protein
MFQCHSFYNFHWFDAQETKDRSDQRVVHSIGAAYGIAQVSYKGC